MDVAEFLKAMFVSLSINTRLNHMQMVDHDERNLMHLDQLLYLSSELHQGEISRVVNPEMGLRQRPDCNSQECALLISDPPGS